MDVVTLALAKKSAKQYTDEVVEGLGKGIIYKGAVDYYNNLPNNASIGDCYSVLYKGTSGTESSGAEYVWGTVNNNNEWIKLGEEIDYATNNVAGILKTGNSLKVSNQGQVYADTLSYNDYQIVGNERFIGKGTLENVLTEKIGTIETILTTLDTGNGVE